MTKAELVFYKYAKEYAPGLPDRKVISDIPSISSGEWWDFVIQKHEADRAGLHYDLRLAPPGGSGLSWAIRRIPGLGEKVEAFRQPDHTVDYFSFQGTIKDGYGAGKVTTEKSGRAEVLKANANKITFYLYETPTNPIKLTLLQIGGDRWLLLNHSTNKTIEKTFAKYKPLTYKDLSQKFRSQAGDIAIPKIDGASSLVILQKEKTPVVLSKRVSKKTGLPIEYTPKIERLLHSRSPASIGNTVLRAEVFSAQGRKELPNRTLGSILNSNVDRSRQLQKDLKAPLRIAAFDVVQYQGKDVSKKPIEERLRILKEIYQKYPQIEDPLTLAKKIKFQEGMVVWRNNKPIKVKNKKDYDVYVKNIFENAPGSRAGGIEYSLTPRGPIVGRVGSGWTHAELNDMIKNKEEYIGRVAKVFAQEQHPSGALRAPSFNTWHLEK